MLKNLMEYAEGNQAGRKAKQLLPNVYIPPPARKLSSQKQNTFERIASTRHSTFDETKACNDSSLLFQNDAGHTYSVLRSNKCKQKNKNQYRKYNSDKVVLPKCDVEFTVKNDTKLDDSSEKNIAPPDITSSKEDIKELVNKHSKLMNNNCTVRQGDESCCCTKEIETNIVKLTIPVTPKCTDYPEHDQTVKFQTLKLTKCTEKEVDNNVNLELGQTSNKVQTRHHQSSPEQDVNTNGKVINDKISKNEVDATRSISGLEQQLGKSSLNDDSRISRRSSIKASETENLKVEENDWETLYDESGDCLADEKAQIPSSSCEKSQISPATSQAEKENKEDMENKESIIEIYGFSKELKTYDLMTVLSPYTTRGLKLAWVDETHALAIFPSPSLADEVLGSDLPLVRTRPLSQGTAASQEKARHLILPSTLRPKTCPAMARRLVSGALGLRLCITPEERAAENEILRKAREEKRLAAKQRDAAWEGVFDRHGT